MFYYLLFIFVSTISSLAYENLALNKPASQAHPHPGFNWGAEKAVDGRYDNRAANGQQCVISANNQRSATWLVNLGRMFSISHINIIYRTDNLPKPSPYVSRLAGFFLYVSNTTSKDDGHLCFHKIQTVNGTPSENQKISCPVLGQYVIFYNERRNDTTYPGYYSTYAYTELCELQVLGCLRMGFYGENCNLPCPNACQNNMCHIHSGECYGCAPGYQESLCGQICGDGRYGAQCSLSCGNCRERKPCHHVNGTCLNGCSEGFQGMKCMDECQEGYYGENCVKRCSESCVNDRKCNRFNGECIGGCHQGWKPPKCDLECDNQMFGVNCSERCGHCLDSKHCHHINGTCLSGCTSGYRGSLCLDRCQSGYYGKNCTYKCSDKCGVINRCNSVTGGCEGGCQPGYTGSLCDKEKLSSCSTEATSMYTSIIINAVVTATIVLIGGIIIYVIWRKNRLKTGKERQRKHNINQHSGNNMQDECNIRDACRLPSGSAEIGTIDKLKIYEELHNYAECV